MTDNDSHRKNKATNSKRCAIYSRYSSDLQRPSSIEDQVRKCRQECERHDGWSVVEEWVVADREVSGRSLVGRDALTALKEAAKMNPRPFDCVLIDDTSRLGRNLPDVLTLADIFKHYEVSLQFVSPPLNSSDPNFRQLLIFKGMMDEQYSVGLAVKVWQALEGRVLKGYNAGGACYGYRNVDEIDPNGKGDGVLGVNLQRVSEQEKVVLRIFEMYANGLSLDKIARTLRADNVPPPKPPRRNSVRGWSADGIAEILRNKKYIGINEWGRTKGVRDPETGQTVTRPIPEHEWVRHTNPEWRIVSDELWRRVQEQLERKKRFGIPKHGGLSRTNRSQQYLFSGLIICGLCGRSINIVDGSGDVMRYGCGAHRYKGACSNAVTIRRDHFEEQLLPWLTRDLLQGDRFEQAVSSFYAKVQQRVSELQAEANRNAVNAPELQKELAQKRQEAWNITDIMAAMGRSSSPLLLSRLQEAEERIKDIEVVLSTAKGQEPIIAFSVEDIKRHLLGKLCDLQAVLTSSPEVGKQILQKHIKKITLTPGESDDKRVFHVAVEFELGGGGTSAVMLTGTGDAFSQQYGFNAITVTGLAIEACRVYRKRAPLPILPERNGAPPTDSAKVVPNRNLAADSATPASEAGAA